MDIQSRIKSSTHFHRLRMPAATLPCLDAALVQRGQQPMPQLKKDGRLVDGADSVSRSSVSRLGRGKDAPGRWKANAFRRSVEQ
jgi:hypothetical protein